MQKEFSEMESKVQETGRDPANPPFQSQQFNPPAHSWGSREPLSLAPLHHCVTAMDRAPTGGTGELSVTAYKEGPAQRLQLCLLGLSVRLLCVNCAVVHGSRLCQS